jgi:hypothetical protein
MTVSDQPLAKSPVAFQICAEDNVATLLENTGPGPAMVRGSIGEFGVIIGAATPRHRTRRVGSPSQLQSSALLAAGARVVITGRRADILNTAVAKLGLGAYCFQQDITDSASIAPLIEGISHDVCEPTILINNAGIHMKKPLVETSDAEFHRVPATHVEGAFAACRAQLFRG